MISYNLVYVYTDCIQYVCILYKSPVSFLARWNFAHKFFKTRRWLWYVCMQIRKTSPDFPFNQLMMNLGTSNKIKGKLLLSTKPRGDGCLAESTRHIT